MNIESDFSKGLELHQSGRLDEAEFFYQRVLLTQPLHSHATHYLGVIAHQRGLYDLAITKLKHAIALCGDHAPVEFYINLANAQKRSGKIEDALKSYQLAITLDPAAQLAWFNLALLQRQTGAIDKAVTSLQNACRIAPSFFESWLELGECHLSQGEDVAALRCLDRALVLQGTTGRNTDALIRIGRNLVIARRYESAIRVFCKARIEHPDNLELLLALGCAQSGEGCLSDAEKTFLQAIDLSPNDLSCKDNLATVWKDQGRVEEALELYRQALREAAPTDPPRSNYLFSLLYSDQLSGEAIFSEHRRASAQYASDTGRHLQPERTPKVTPRPLRVGYLSGDLYNHPVAYFLAGVLGHHDPSVVKIFIYCNNVVSDQWTQRLRLLVPHWCNVYSIHDHDLWTQIRKDRIDVLVDLSGHTADNRLNIFAMRAAPVQISYLGYPFSTATPNMDWRIVDSVVDPSGADGLSTERLWRLPRSYYGYSPPEDAPEVAPLPLLSRKHLTFGVSSNLAKVSPTALDQWTRILAAFPGSRLRWRAKAFSDEEVKNRMIKSLLARGISKNKLKLDGWSTSKQRWLFYQQVDVALDTYPYNQATNTCEALWMGVPTLTVAGNTHHSRMGASIMTSAGLSDWIVPSPEALGTWLEHSENPVTPKRLTEIRRGMRTRLLASELFDTRQLTEQLEAAYGEMYERSFRTEAPANNL